MRIILASLLSAVVLFIWGFLSWAVLPWHMQTMNALGPTEDTVVATLTSSGAKTGAYYFPNHPPANCTPEQQEAYFARHKKGPIGMIMYSAEGVNPMDPKQMARGFVLGFLGSLLAAGIVAESTHAQASWFVRVLIVVCMGAFAAVTSHLALWNWMHFPRDWSVVMAADNIVSALLSGIVIASIVKPKKPKVEPTPA